LPKYKRIIMQSVRSWGGICGLKGGKRIVKRQFAQGNGTREDYRKKFSSHGPPRARNSRSRVD